MNKSHILKYFSEDRNLILGFVVFGLVATLILGSYYYSVHRLILANELLHQKSRVNALVQKIQNYSAISSQLGRTLQNHLSESHLNQKQIEGFLNELLKSGPSDLIYGVGAWYEPYQFQSDKIFFGPYVHRDSENNHKTILTYEWNTPEYNYHSQEWYKSSVHHQEKGIYIEPYFDAGLVYVTYSRPFFNPQKKLMGVLTVDMILPQLQRLINEFNAEQAETLFIESRNGYLLGHPLEVQFLEKVKLADKKSLIQHKIADLNMKLYLQNRENQVLRYQETVPELDWRVIIESEKSFILKDSYRLAKIIVFGLTLFWICILSIIYFIVRSRRNKLVDELKIKEHQAQLVNSNRLATLGEFSSGIAHEVNNPLAIIVGKTEKLLKSIQIGIYDPELFQAELQKIYSSTERISKIIRGLKVISRDVESDPFLKVSLNQIFTETFAICADQIKAKNITFRQIPFFDVQISCRQNQISQVLLNLVSNSMDAIELQKSPWIQVEVQTSTDVQIIVTDSGEGIPAEVAQKIMQPFYTTKPVNKGTGLGLSISCGIIKDHGGELIYNANSKNTQFIIKIPISQ